jgi:hypothetical protein
VNSLVTLSFCFQALEVAEVLSDSLERYHCLLQLFPFLLRQPLESGATHPLLDRASETIGSHQWEGLSLQQERTLEGLVRRYGEKLIKGGCAERAFRLARRLDVRGWAFMYTPSWRCSCMNPDCKQAFLIEENKSVSYLVMSDFIICLWKGFPDGS